MASGYLHLTAARNCQLVSGPGADVYCRVFTDGAGSDWPLSQVRVYTGAGTNAKKPTRGWFPLACPLSGSQQPTRQWDVAIKQCAAIFDELSTRGVELSLLNIGGGFPVTVSRSIP